MGVEFALFLSKEAALVSQYVHIYITINPLF